MLTSVDCRKGQVSIVRHFDWERTALIICDMWDAHHCASAERRVAEMAPSVDALASALRTEGALIVHCPSGCMPFYRDTPARARASGAPHAFAPVLIDWNDLDRDRESPMRREYQEPGACSCLSAAPCCTAGPPYPWSRQIEAIGVREVDAVTDDGQEVHNLLSARGIEDVIVAGVHTNVCVLGRPFGIRQLVYSGKRPVLCRDLTDAFHRAPVPHCEGTRDVVAHIEKHWCPSMTSDQLLGGPPFAFDECEG